MILTQHKAASLCEKARWYERNHQYGAAALCVEKALDADPVCVEALVLRAQIACAERDFETARACAELLTTQEPARDEGWQLLGKVLYELDDHTAALRALAEAVRLRPDDAGSWFLQGAIHNMQGNADRAVSAFSRAIEIEPRGLTAWYGKALALKNLNRYDESRDCFSRIQQMNLELRSA